MFGQTSQPSVLSDPFLNVVRALAGTELDDPEVSEVVLVKRIFPDDGFDLLSTIANGHDDPAISRDLSTRDQEIPGSIILLQEHDVRGHVGVNFCELGLVDKFDDEHRGLQQSVVRVRRCTEGGDAPGWQGATSENTGSI
jgi:hypothetical protein